MDVVPLILTSRRQIAFSFLLLIFLIGAAYAQAAPVADRHADHIVVDKSRHVLTLYSHDKLLRTYKVALGGNPVGAKEKQGDHKTPEGHYLIDAKNARSQFDLALHVSYPNAVDRARAAKAGVPPGGDIMIHGLPAKYAWVGALHRQTDWTDGCVAVTNAEIEEIFKLVPVGTPIDIEP
jgi:murein L,D-transpeptidase YafK